MSDLSDSLLRGAKEALDYAKGEPSDAKLHAVTIPDEVDVKAIRRKLHLSRAEFARRFGFNLRTLEKWEQGTRHPDISSRAYLTVISRAPEQVSHALNC